MSSSIDTRAPFFPNSKETSSPRTNAKPMSDAQGISPLQRNTPEKASSIAQRTATDARVNINEGVKDFSKIKKAVDAAPMPDNSEKIARLKSQIAGGTYQPDYD